MKLVLLSGGSGKRLWPLSNDCRSKQFLKVLKHPEKAIQESMVQRVWRQLTQSGLSGDAYIATSKSQQEMLQSQLGMEVPLIVEPERRDTFPAIALAAVYLYSMEAVPLDEVVVVLPVDPFVDQPFFEKLKELEQAVRSEQAELTLMGVRPTHPSEKYGYIVPEAGVVDQQNPLVSADCASSVCRVHRFQEKPSESQAIELIGQKALWNCGVFAFRMNTFIQMLMQRGLPIQYEAMVKQYSRMKKISFDYEVVEKTSNIAVIPYEGRWKDLGTWNTLTEEMNDPVMGKGILSEDARNTHLINELDIPVTIIGLSNVVVATSPDGILVTDKTQSPRIKEVLPSHSTRPMYEERRWGSYRVIDYSKLEGEGEVLTKRIRIAAGHNLSYQWHEKRSEVWTILSGRGRCILDGELKEVRGGDVIVIPVGAKHSIRALEELEIIEVQRGSELIEEDIVRESLHWEEIMALGSRKGDFTHAIGE
ncbi:sugar phosphate nucleotidyltransferase [Marinicrinis sediminis]|uniref:Sugar phosphate nucleotidyltransferase n=1 Tax=Marinicrinis sediminis TaxID=1652465 RepID=A0ABW5RDD1_9BACL